MDREYGKMLVRRGALQVCASMLVDQLPQQGAGNEEIYKGMRLIEEARDAANKRRKSGSVEGARATVKAVRERKKKLDDDIEL